MVAPDRRDGTEGEGEGEGKGNGVWGGRAKGGGVEGRGGEGSVIDKGWRIGGIVFLLGSWFCGERKRKRKRERMRAGGKIYCGGGRI